MFFDDAEVGNGQPKMEENDCQGRWAWTKTAHSCSSHKVVGAAADVALLLLFGSYESSLQEVGNSIIYSF